MMMTMVTMMMVMMMMINNNDNKNGTIETYDFDFLSVKNRIRLESFVKFDDARRHFALTQ